MQHLLCHGRVQLTYHSAKPIPAEPSQYPDGFARKLGFRVVRLSVCGLDAVGRYFALARRSLADHVDGSAAARISKAGFHA
jgi:hypothetical protein